MTGKRVEGSNLGFVDRLKKAAGHQNYTTEEIAKLSTKAAELLPEKRTSLIDGAIRKLEKHAPKDQTFEQQTEVVNNVKTQKLAKAIMRMSEHWNKQQQDRIGNLSSDHPGIETVMREQLVAVDKETRSRQRGLDERPPRSSSRSR